MREIYKEFERNNDETTKITQKLNDVVKRYLNDNDFLSDTIRNYVCKLIEVNLDREILLLNFLLKIEKSENLGGTKK